MGYIYLIKCNITNKKYYGSTTQLIEKRLKDHEYHHNRYKKGKIYFISSSIVLENNNYNISLIEDCGDIDKKQLKDRERYYIENNACVNIKTPNRSTKEWREDTNYNSIYYKKNKEYYDNHNKEYYEKNKSLKQEYNKKLDKYKNSWGGNYKTNTHNNLLRIDINIFKI